SVDLFVLDRVGRCHSLQLKVMKLLYAFAMGHRNAVDLHKYKGIAKIGAVILPTIGKLVPLKTICKQYRFVATLANPKDVKKYKTDARTLLAKAQVQSADTTAKAQSQNTETAAKAQNQSEEIKVAYDTNTISGFALSDKVYISNEQQHPHYWGLCYDMTSYKKGTTKIIRGLELQVPSGYDATMSVIYGDYMKLPPVEQQVCQHVEIE
ncbi:MAG: hypothetical protein K6A23_04785, partial [Butyrivibrio sp.]|nr:hypothetical protein [Butyrivibrio sp.]